jgi:Tfp pilus assembly protein PilF
MDRVKKRSLAPLSLFLLLLALPGCADTNQERLQQLNDDGLFLFKKGDYDNARQSFEAALKIQPDDAALLYNIGQCHDRVGNAVKAEKTYKDLVEAYPNHGPGRHALAVLLFRQGRRKEADAMIESWLARQPQRADPYIEDGWRLRQDGDLLQAQARLQQALDLEPQNARALIEMAILYEVMERPSRALDLYDRALRLDPQQAEVAERAAQLRAKGVKQPLPD